jgi:hypothetical protein
VDILWKISKITGTDIRWLLEGNAEADVSSCEAVPKPLQSKISVLCQSDPQTMPALNAFVDLLLEKSGKHPRNGSQAKTEVRRPWIPILGRTAAGIAQFWPEKTKPLPDVTELSQLIKTHQTRHHHDQQPSDICSDVGEAPPPGETTGKPIKFIHLTEVPADGIVEFIESETIYRLHPDAFALRVDGDSMAPRIHDGDIVVLSPSAAFRDGMTAVVQLKNQIGVTCKIIRQEQDNIHLIPANEHYEIKVYPRDQAAWIIPVLWRIRM